MEILDGSGDEGPLVNTSIIDALSGPAAERTRLTVIIVNYNSWPEVLRLVSELEAEPELDAGKARLVVVDNASQGPVPVRFTIAHSAGIRVFSRPHNDGFAAGVNAGWREARTPWLLVLNPDVEIERGLIGQVIERIDQYSRRASGPPGIVGFGLRNSDGSRQGSVGVFPSLSRTIREQFIPRSRRKYQAGWRIRSGPVDWVTGACMLVNSTMMAELGGMDEDFFLYYEEVAFCRAARRFGWSVEFDPGVTVIHRHPLQNRIVSPKMRVITRHSKLLYFRKHLPRWQFLGLSWIVTLEAAVRYLEARLLRQPMAPQAWQTVGRIASRLRSGEDLRGRDVLKLAEAVESNLLLQPPVQKRPHASCELQTIEGNCHHETSGGRQR
jgi:GT2 family glycosyltransferase